MIDTMYILSYNCSQKIRGRIENFESATIVAPLLGYWGKEKIMGIESSYFVVSVYEQYDYFYHNHPKKTMDGQWEESLDDVLGGKSCSLITQCPDLDSAQRERNRCVSNSTETRVDSDDPTSPLLNKREVHFWVVKWCELVKFLHDHQL